MSAFKRLLREYNLISSAIIAFIGFALIMEWVDLTQPQMGGLLGLVAAVLLVLRFLVTPVNSPNLPIGTEVNVNSKVTTGIVVPRD